jgi:nucleoid-associated protein YgaU
LGCPRNKSVRKSIRLTSAAAPALLGVAAAIALSAQATPAHASVSTTAHRVSNVRLLSATRLAAPKPVSVRKYTVRTGDTLSSIAQSLYNDSGAWPVLYWANRHQIRWANDIEVGQVLTVPAKPAKIPAVPSQLAPVSDPAPVSEPVQAAEPVQTAAPVQTAVTYTGGSSLQQCVIEAESGGDSQVMNSSGHYGLYQFSASTWAEYGGNPGDFGDASVAEQNQVYETAIDDGGASNWTAYDGC